MKRSLLRFGSRQAMSIVITIGLATVISGARAQAPDVREQEPVEKFQALFELASEPGHAELRAATLAGVEVEEFEEFVQVLRAQDSQVLKRAETSSANDVAGSVSVAARCAEGWIASTRIEKSANDVEILSEERVACDESGCKAVQVNARRATDEPFSLVVSVTCNG